MNTKRTPLYVLILLLAISACNRHYVPAKVEWRDYRVTGNAPKDSSLLRMLQPYTDSIDKTMNRVLARVTQNMEKKQPEGPLGDLLVDAMRAMAEKKFGMKVDAAFVNFGGIRLTTLTRGDLTIGKVYELMPFDNVIVLQKMKGSVLKTFLDHISRRGGWPVSGLTYDIQNNRAVNVQVGGQPLDEGAEYTICNSDFIANGGDECAMLRPIKQVNRNVLMRDAFIEYFEALGAGGKEITEPAGNRVRTL